MARAKAPATAAWQAAPDPAPQPAPAAAAPPRAAGSPMDDRQYAMLLHLSALAGLILGTLFFLGPLIMWLVKKDQSPFIDRHGRAAMDFHISVIIYAAAAGILFAVLLVMTLGLGIILLLPAIILLAIAAGICVILFPILAALRANEGKEYAYPLSLRLLRRAQ